MIVIGLILSVFGVGYLCWLLVHACGLCATPLRRHDGGSRRVSQRCRPRRTCGGVGRGRAHPRCGPSRLCSHQIAGATLGDRHPFRGAGRHCRLPRNADPCPHWRAFGQLAGSLCSRRRDLRRWIGFRSHGGHGHPARCQTHWRGGTGSATDHDRDKPALKLADPSPRLSADGRLSMLARPTIEQRGLERRADDLAPLPGRTIEHQKRRSSSCGVLVSPRGLPFQRSGLFLYTLTLRPLVLRNRCRSRFLPQMLFKRTRAPGLSLA
jgi:hypothetical protein